ncbi:hypothetical protein N8I71_08430 [Roseibacterium sp. SDUM158016]|uniref:hypothetical protein n=1 Tax=Roseicyclus sediminis TaxID=2980997 RepID=UPI0021D06BDB|nr:hypothetical protein [Roseibacterium sp. SDUM158016]MCU4652855.1 hypothetical protein [Roseibacterium sp. SDUM158016]
MFKDFIQSESGAITVDWVVLTAGITGMAIATVAVVSGGVENLAGDTSSQLSGFSIQTAFAVSQSLLSTDFSEGIGAWVGGTVASLTGFGDVLQLGPGELAQMTLAVPAGAQTATISFDMLGIDDLSGEPATVFINGQPVAIYSDNHGNITTSEMGVPGVTVEVSQQYTNDPVGAGSHGNDSRATYTITVENPGETLTFGVASGTGQPISEEFYAIDDVAISAN